MSAIISGRSCKNCNKKNWYISLGHPKWWHDIVIKGKKKNLTYATYEHILRSGLCPKCYISSIKENSDEFDVDLLNVLAKIL
jgi:hypothetical protein